MVSKAVANRYFRIAFCMTPEYMRTSHSIKSASISTLPVNLQKVCKNSFCHGRWLRIPAKIKTRAIPRAFKKCVIVILIVYAQPPIMDFIGSYKCRLRRISALIIAYSGCVVSYFCISLAFTREIVLLIDKRRAIPLY